MQLMVWVVKLRKSKQVEYHVGYIFYKNGQEGVRYFHVEKW